MNAALSKSRERAEAAFALTQTQFLARGQAVAERDALAVACEEKTARLRGARLAKEEQDRARSQRR